MNIPLLCLPIAYALVFAPKVPLSMAMAKQPEGYDNKTPRDQQAKLEGWGRRAAAAHANAFESFAPFAAGVLASTVGGGDAKWAAILAIAHVVSRTIYPVLYIANIDKARSTVWGVGMLASFGLMILPLMK
ncbi:MAG: MAPEG family protein [Myxococcales bacterium]|nr:MAPEG family protein [Myxococcales bacterium]